jgi:hypothetical protein
VEPVDLALFHILTQIIPAFPKNEGDIRNGSFKMELRGVVIPLKTNYVEMKL